MKVVITYAVNVEIEAPEEAILKQVQNPYELIDEIKDAIEIAPQTDFIHKVDDFEVKSINVPDYKERGYIIGTIFEQ